MSRHQSAAALCQDMRSLVVAKDMSFSLTPSRRNISPLGLEPVKGISPGKEDLFTVLLRTLKHPSILDSVNDIFLNVFSSRQPSSMDSWMSYPAVIRSSFLWKYLSTPLSVR